MTLALEDVHNTNWDYNTDAAENFFRTTHCGVFLHDVLPAEIEARIRVLALARVTYEEDGAWAKVFSTMNSHSLFALVCRSADLAPIVVAYLTDSTIKFNEVVPPLLDSVVEGSVGSHEAKPPCHLRMAAMGSSQAPWGGRPVLDSVPNEVYSTIFTHLVLLDRSSLGQTSSRARTLAAASTQSAATTIFRQLGLVLSSIRFMQSITSCFITGSFVQYLLTLPPADLMDVKLTRLYFYASRGKFDWVVTYLRMTTPFTTLGRTIRRSKYSDSCVDGGQVLQDASERELVIVRSCTSNALDLVLQLPYSSWFGGLTHRGLWHGHPGPTCRMECMPNQPYVELRYPAAKLEAMVNVRKLLRSGFSLSRCLDERHLCPGESRCPRTSRISFDRACLSLVFPAACFGEEVSKTVLSNVQHVSWSLGAMGPCPKGYEVVRRETRTLTRAFSDTKSTVWRLRWDSFYRTALELSGLLGQSRNIGDMGVESGSSPPSKKARSSRDIATAIESTTSKYIDAEADESEESENSSSDADSIKDFIVSDNDEDESSAGSADTNEDEISPVVSRSASPEASAVKFDTCALSRWGGYQSTFGAVRVSSGLGRQGDVFQYLSFDESKGRRRQVQPSRRRECMPFVGCVTSISQVPARRPGCTLWSITLDPPPNSTEGAIALSALQQDFLREISDLDVRGESEQCIVRWGEQSVESPTPKVVISLCWRGFPVHGVPRLLRKPIALGDDVIINCYMRREDAPGERGLKTKASFSLMPFAWLFNVSSALHFGWFSAGEASPQQAQESAVVVPSACICRRYNAP
ncbi:hypothetical protein C8R43DRAFT_1133829 [Mycena crocata]|nr:hypothetical protein C8R43DRAFT_1133829 [Mycena crocata]